VLNGNLEVTRRYTLAPNKSDDTDPYQLHHETTFKNLSAQTAPIPRVALSIGTAAPVSAHDPGDQLTSGYSTGKDQAFTARAKLEQSNGFFGLGASAQKALLASPGPLAWASLGNQFFTTVLTPDEPAAGLVTRRVKLFPLLPDEDRNSHGLTAAVQFDVKPLAAQGESRIAANFYVGPKEYRRLANSAVFKADQDKVMQYGFFKFFSALIVTLMNWMHGIAGNWGVAIVMSTLLLKIIFLPLTIKATRSMKRMAKLAPLMTAIREKFKDNPAKQQSAMMELYKEHKVNPMGGCLPMLIPFPFFIGFFSMLRSSAELRYAPFLWAPDLASTDTVGHLLGISINILPLLFTSMTFIQMRITPTPNADPAQAKMMQFMPLIFLFIYYNMPAALSLYSTANAIFTIVQQVVINRMKDDGDPTNAPLTAGPGGKVIKNVTPKKK
jgi:YidC/Oxa1 family membrane protein insertase